MKKLNNEKKPNTNLKKSDGLAGKIQEKIGNTLPQKILNKKSSNFTENSIYSIKSKKSLDKETRSNNNKEGEKEKENLYLSNLEKSISSVKAQQIKSNLIPNSKSFKKSTTLKPSKGNFKSSILNEINRSGFPVQNQRKTITAISKKENNSLSNLKKQTIINSSRKKNHSSIKSMKVSNNYNKGGVSVSSNKNYNNKMKTEEKPKRLVHQTNYNFKLDKKNYSLMDMRNVSYISDSGLTVMTSISNNYQKLLEEDIQLKKQKIIERLSRQKDHEKRLKKFENNPKVKKVMQDSNYSTQNKTISFNYKHEDLNRLKEKKLKLQEKLLELKKDLNRKKQKASAKTTIEESSKRNKGITANTYSNNNSLLGGNNQKMRINTNKKIVENNNQSNNSQRLIQNSYMIDSLIKQSKHIQSSHQKIKKHGSMDASLKVNKNSINQIENQGQRKSQGQMNTKTNNKNISNKAFSKSKTIEIISISKGKEKTKNSVVGTTDATTMKKLSKYQPTQTRVSMK